MPTEKDEVRRKLASFINASTDEVVINRNTTEGINTAAHGLELKAGDEVLLSSQEHPGGTHPWKLREKRHGIKIVEAKIGAPPKDVGEIIDAFKKAITPRTKVISVSHTVYITGLIFPMKEVSDLAHEHDIIVIADSAHGLGMLNLNMKKLGMDVFCSSPYKWLGAPTGSGIMYVRKEVQDKIYPLIATSGWDSKNAQRFETLSQRADPIIIAMGEAINFQNRVGKSRIERRIKSLASYLKEGLKSIPKVRLHTPVDPYLSGGLTAFSIDGVEPGYIVDYMREKYNIVIRTIGRDKDKTRGVRVSTNIYISNKHVDLVLVGINYLAKRA
jgi:selenocysteine lyase/cysteine desulfurase